MNAYLLPRTRRDHKTARSGTWVRHAVAAMALLSAGLLATNPVGLVRAHGAALRFAQPCGNSGTPTTVHHVIWIWMENEAYASVIDNANAPYQTSLAHQCGLPTNFHNESHGSLDNYVAATSGLDILGTSFVNDCLPNDKANYCVSSGPSLFSQAQAAGDSWRGYAEDMATNCDQANSGNYAARHNPAVYFSTLSTCSQFDVPMGSLTTQTGAFYTDLETGTLPSFSFITPNLIDDAHSSSTATGDTWLSQIVPLITSSPNYQSGDTDIFITNDEGGGSDHTNDEDCSDPTLDLNQPSCHIPTIVVGPYIPTGTVSSTFYTHYSMLRTAEELLDLPLLGLAAQANSMTAAFNLEPGSVSLPSSPSSPTNLLTNGGFETWNGSVPAKWTTYGPATSLVASSDAHTGALSIRIATTKSSYAASGINDGAKPSVSSTVPGVSYTATCWAKVSKPITVTFSFTKTNKTAHRGTRLRSPH